MIIDQVIMMIINIMEMIWEQWSVNWRCSFDNWPSDHEDDQYHVDDHQYKNDDNHNAAHLNSKRRILLGSKNIWQLVNDQMQMIQLVEQKSILKNIESENEINWKLKPGDSCVCSLWA